MVSTTGLDALVHEGLKDVQFRVADPQKRARFQGRDLLALIQIVTCRKTYAAPHGTGEDEWQAVADELNRAVTGSFSFRACRDKVAILLREHKRSSAASRRASGIDEKHTGLADLVEGYLQLKTRFEEKQQAEKDAKDRKRQRLASAGNKAMRKAAPRLKHRRLGTGKEARRRGATRESDDGNDDSGPQGDGGAAQRGRDQSQLRLLLGSDYSSDGDGGHEDEESSDEDNNRVGRKRLRVSEIWAKEEAMMMREKAAQAELDKAFQNMVETMVNQNKLLMKLLTRDSGNFSNQQ